jgi:hypothetical protein
MASSSPCDTVSVGIDASRANNSAGDILGEAAGQTFFAPDTLVHSLTVWRVASECRDWQIGIHLYITEADSNGRPLTNHIVLDGPSIYIPESDCYQPVPFRWVFNPPLVLPRRVTYAFFLQVPSSQCPNYFDVLGRDGNDYPEGHFWWTDRSSSCGLRLSPNSNPNADLCFTIKFLHPLSVSLVNAQADTCGVLLTWSAADSSGLAATVYRREVGSDWNSIGQVSADATGRIVFDDFQVVPGARYDYRLGVNECGAEAPLGETSVDVPGDLRVALLGAEADLGHMRLTWSVTGAGGQLTTVYRRATGDEWRPLAQIFPDGAGLLAYDDTQVTAGMGYGYRLGLTACGREVFLGQTPTEVSVPAEFGFESLGPNPTSEGLTVAFSLSDATPAHLEVMDITGRRLLFRDLGGMGPGSHTTKLSAGRRMPAGVYLVRLTQDERSRTTRWVVVR